MANFASRTVKRVFCVVNPQSTLAVTHPVDVRQDALTEVNRPLRADTAARRHCSRPLKAPAQALANGHEQRYHSYAPQTGVPEFALRSSGLIKPRATAVRARENG